MNQILLQFNCIGFTKPPNESITMNNEVFIMMTSLVKTLFFSAQFILLFAPAIFSKESLSENFNFQCVENAKQVQLLLTSDKIVYEPCEPIILSITATNISSTTMAIIWPDFLRERNFSFTIAIMNKTMIQNEFSPLTNYGKKLYQGLIRENVSSWFQSFKPNETYTRKIQIDRIHDMSLRGDYIISASFQCADFASKIISFPKTSTIQITISHNNPSIKSNSTTMVPFSIQLGNDTNSAQYKINAVTEIEENP